MWISDTICIFYIWKNGTNDEHEIRWDFSMFTILPTINRTSVKRQRSTRNKLIHSSSKYNVLHRFFIERAGKQISVHCSAVSNSTNLISFFFSNSDWSKNQRIKELISTTCHLFVSSNKSQSGRKNDRKVVVMNLFLLSVTQKNIGLPTQWILIGRWNCPRNRFDLQWTVERNDLPPCHENTLSEKTLKFQENNQQSPNLQMFSSERRMCWIGKEFHWSRCSLVHCFQCQNSRLIEFDFFLNSDCLKN